MKSLLLLFILVFGIHAQENNVIRDTSFNTKSAAINVLKDFPLVQIVKSEVPKSITANYEIEYAERGKRKLHMDIFTPKKKKRNKLPFVLIIHGGGWRSGDKSMEWPTAIHLAKNGYVAATVEYRLSGEAKYPAAIYDLKEALRWIRKNANKFNVDPTKIVVSGVSAGGMLAAFLGTTGELQHFEGDSQLKKYSTKVQAVVDIDGIVDFTHPAESGKDSIAAKPSAGKAWFGATYKENPIIWKEASPIRYVSDKTPPILFINSSQDRYHAGRDEMIEKLNKYKIYSKVYTIPDTPHTFWLFHPWFDEAMKFLLDFLTEVFEEKNFDNWRNNKQKF